MCSAKEGRHLVEGFGKLRWGNTENEDAWLVEVREVDLARGGDVVEKALGMA